MNRLVLAFLALGLSFVVVARDGTVQPNTEQAEAIAAIEKSGGKVTVDEKAPDKPVIAVDFQHTHVTDAGLEPLRVLPKLQTLTLRLTQ